MVFAAGNATAGATATNRSVGTLAVSNLAASNPNSAGSRDGGPRRGRQLLGKQRGKRTRRAPLAVVPWDEPLSWDVSLGRCVSAKSGRVVAWASGKPLEAESRRKDERVCCTFNTLVTSWWNEMLHPKRWRPLPRP